MNESTSDISKETFGETFYNKFVEPKETSETVWNKFTLQYCVNNIEEVKRQVRMKALGLSQVQVEDIFSNLIVYLAGADDYNPTRENACRSIENYIGIGINYVVQRYRSELSKEVKHLEKETIIKEEDGSERSVLDNVSDDKALKEMYDKDFELDSSLKNLEEIRYINNFDIFSVLYIRLLSDDEHYEQNLMAIGIDRKALKEINKQLKKVEELRELVKAITLFGKEETIIKLEKYVHGHKFIREAIM